MKLVKTVFLSTLIYIAVNEAAQWQAEARPVFEQAKAQLIKAENPTQISQFADSVRDLARAPDKEESAGSAFLQRVKGYAVRQFNPDIAPYGRGMMTSRLDEDEVLSQSDESRWKMPVNNTPGALDNSVRSELRTLLANLPWSNAQVIGEELTLAYQECDQAAQMRDTRSAAHCSDDPNNNTRIMRFPDQTIYFDAKMAIDTDGAPLVQSRTHQLQTSYQFTNVSGNPNLASDRIPYIVLPQGEAFKKMGVKLGDLAAVVWNGQVAYALVGDYGPSYRLGEGSIALHEQLGHRICQAQDQQGNCTKVLQSSIGNNVQYFIFPQSSLEGLNPNNINAMVNQYASTLFRIFLHSKENLARASHADI